VESRLDAVAIARLTRPWTNFCASAFSLTATVTVFPDLIDSFVVPSGFGPCPFIRTVSVPTQRPTAPVGHVRDDDERSPIADRPSLHNSTI